MDPKQQTPEEYDQPVAYDAEGRPLYTHPAGAAKAEAVIATQAVHMSQPKETKKPFISDATKIKHDQSGQLYPDLNLSDGEYVIIAVRRHPIGIFLQLAFSVVIISLALSILLNYDLVVQNLHLTGTLADSSIASLIIFLVVILVCLFTYVAYFVYSNNRFYLTNESIIEQIQSGLFERREQTISLGSIKDASYLQKNLMEGIFEYGSIRLSTIGGEMTYRFIYVEHPKQVIDTLNNAVEAFKNERPVGGRV
jgi:uncharacterized membrane protein YdbT with pleckstrin-like domain